MPPDFPNFSSTGSCNISTTYDPGGNPNDVYNDASALIAPEETPIVSRRSCVCYEGFSPPHTYFEFSQKFNEGGDMGFSVHGDSLTPDVLSKVRRGADVSQHITPYAHEILQNQGLV